MLVYKNSKLCENVKRMGILPIRFELILVTNEIFKTLSKLKGVELSNRLKRVSDKYKQNVSIDFQKMDGQEFDELMYFIYMHLQDEKDPLWQDVNAENIDIYQCLNAAILKELGDVAERKDGIRLAALFIWIDNRKFVLTNDLASDFIYIRNHRNKYFGSKNTLESLEEAILTMENKLDEII